MPTSNGLVTSRDIRQNAVKALHLIDGAVETAKIPDLAVTYPDKIDAPFWVALDEPPSEFDVSLSTSEALFATSTFDIPAWVNQVFVHSIAAVKIQNASGSAYNLSVACRVMDNADGSAFLTVPNNSVATLYHLEVASLFNVAGSTVTINSYAWLSSGTNSNNSGSIFTFMVGTR